MPITANCSVSSISEPITVEFSATKHTFMLYNVLDLIPFIGSQFKTTANNHTTVSYFLNYECLPVGCLAISNSICFFSWIVLTTYSKSLVEFPTKLLPTDTTTLPDVGESALPVLHTILGCRKRKFNFWRGIQ